MHGGEGMCGGRRTSVGRWFPPSPWVPESRSLGLCVLLLSELSTGSGPLFERRGSRGTELKFPITMPLTKQAGFEPVNPLRAVSILHGLYRDIPTTFNKLTMSFYLYLLACKLPPAHLKPHNRMCPFDISVFYIPSYLVFFSLFHSSFLFRPGLTV